MTSEEVLILLERLRVEYKMRPGYIALGLGCTRASLRRWQIGCSIGPVLAQRLRDLVATKDKRRALTAQPVIS